MVQRGGSAARCVEQLRSQILLDYILRLMYISEACMCNGGFGMVDCAHINAHFLFLLLLQANMAGGWRCHAEPRVVAEAGVMTGAVTGAVVTTGGVMTTGAHLVAAGER
jgi:hypothetical protein